MRTKTFFLVMALAAPCIAAVAFSLDVSSLPPAVQARHYIRNIGDAIENSDHEKVVVFCEDLLLKEEIDVDPEIIFFYARSLLELGRFDEAALHAETFLNMPDIDEDLIEGGLEVLEKAQLRENDQTEKERMERAEKEQIEKEQIEKERIEKERAERAEKERIKKAQLEKERAELAEKERLERERARSVLSAAVKDITLVDVNAHTAKGWRALEFHLDFDVKNCRGKNIEVGMVLFHADGRKLLQHKNHSSWLCPYHLPDLQLCVFDSSTPKYDSSTYTDFSLFFPCCLSPMAYPSGSMSVTQYFKVQIWCDGKLIGESGMKYFTFTHAHNNHYMLNLEGY